MKKVLIASVMAFVLVSGTMLSAFALDQALFFVNDPKNLTFTDMRKVAGYVENYYRQSGIVNSDDMAKFFNAVRGHGAPNAGTDQSLVGMIVQDKEYPGNNSGEARGVLVIYGQFDKAALLDIMQRNYKEHMEKTGHEAVFADIATKGGTVHKFGLPAKNRELTMLSFARYCIFQSGAVGDTSLLNQTIQALTQKQIQPVSTGESMVRYMLRPSADERQQLQDVATKKFNKYKEEQVLKNRKGLRKFFANRIANSKLKFVNKSIAELENAEIFVERMRDGDVNTKRMRVVSTFADKGQARDVKKKVLSHLNSVIRDAQNPEDKLGMSNNVRVTTDGNTMQIETQLATEEEQLHTFAIISSFIARAMLRD